MSDKEKIERELNMLSRDLIAMQRDYLMRKLRNKRLPISERLAALMRYQDMEDDSLFDGMEIDSSDQKIFDELYRLLESMNKS
jgi:hypothetical protein